jgi:hypothetical protein
MIRYNPPAMSRIINPDSVGKDRTRLTRAIVLAIRELAKQTDTGPESQDLAAFIALALQSISDGIDASVAAWEKRGYWVKADKFRMEWMWAGESARKFRTALESEDWGAIAVLAAHTAQKFGKIQIAEHHRLGKPWAGAFKHLKAD